MSKYILALDQSMAVSRGILFDDDGNVVCEAKRDVPQMYPQQGWVEHDAMEIWSSQYAVMMEVIAQSGVDPKDLAGIGIANQRETTILWEKSTGRPIYNAISWQCRRTAPIVQELLDKGLDDYIRKTTGLIPDAYFSATKIKWILDQVPGARQRAEKGEILFGTVDSWLLWKLTGGAVHATDYTNASRTMLFDIERLQWDDTLLNVLDIPRVMLPEVHPSSYVYGTVNIGCVPVPIAAIAGDQQAALFGQGCFEEGKAKNTYVTGCFLLMNTGERLVRSKCGMLAGLACSRDDHPQYILEGSVFAGGAVIDWLKDSMRFIEGPEDAAYYAQKVPDNGGVYMVPAFTGLGAPYWDMYARGCIVGITRGTKREHLIRAAQESIAYQTADLVQAMECDSGIQIQELEVDGAATRERFLMQFQANILNKRLRRPATRNTIALGSAFLAGLAVGVWNELWQLETMLFSDSTYNPMMEQAERTRLLEGWHRAVGRSLDWEKHD